jgi:spermidine synthase
MLSSLHFVENPKKILILGMGIGTLSKTLAEILPESQIDVVDINSNLLEINKKYFDFDIEKYKNVFFYHEDAFEYLKNLNKEIKYDIIIGDVFDKQYIPEKFLTN